MCRHREKVAFYKPRREGFRRKQRGPRLNLGLADFRK